MRIYAMGIKGYRLLYQAFTQKDIDRVRNRTKVGDKLYCSTYKSNPDSKIRTDCGQIRKGKVIHKSKWFAVIELPGGIRDSVLWVELLANERKKMSCG